jgi:RNA polymerase sigma-70 factor (ECF subfamily)
MTSLPPALCKRLFERAGAARWRVSTARFTEALTTSATKAFAGKSASADDLDTYFSSLHLEDLALACACAAGDEAAWEHFVREHRPVLYRAADAIEPGGGARELADSLYGELFGTSEREGERRSLFRYFHGRSSLSTWLRSVLSQRFVDRVRTRRREDVLPEEDSPTALPAPDRPLDPERDRYMAMMRSTLARAVAALSARDRLRLTSYYVQDLTLAAIGRLLKEHEATVSRHLTRTRKEIREAIERSLRDDHGLDDRAIAECLGSILSDPGSLDLRELAGTGPDRKNDGPDRSH